MLYSVIVEAVAVFLDRIGSQPDVFVDYVFSTITSTRFENILENCEVGIFSDEGPFIQDRGFRIWSIAS